MNNSLKELNLNKNSNGGGLAKNITGKFESNRHAIAKLEKYTFGQVVAELKKKKNGGIVISAKKLLDIYTVLFGVPEWHHAGQLPKHYGGGMKKTYFLNKIPTADIINNWLVSFEIKQKEITENQNKINLLLNKKNEFIKKFGAKFLRESVIPKFSLVQYSEMEGKFGWFIVESYHNYTLPKYYSGIYFKSKKKLDQFNNL